MGQWNQHDVRAGNQAVQSIAAVLKQRN